ncbi:hypothetical protein FA13DRAFT_1774273 [Coprinellus micaceus]|uniref:Uncharacterized protein n=1 Tax=Coprinellus micaceus TaxID=71717 RepID=A0A4Y7TCT1_COPMI|nr:hypothetical protein FA13DRAFT_1774273 [Coprinellus micaceus]
MALDWAGAQFIGTFLEWGLMGAYMIIFGLCIQILRKRRAALRVVDYGLFVLFALCLSFVILDTCQQFQSILHGDAPWTGKVNSAASTLCITLDFLSQVILIYRCWIVWGGRFWVIALPALLALTAWVAGLCVTIDLASMTSSWYPEFMREWWVPLATSGMAISLATNATVSALMIGRILHVYRVSHGASHGTARRASWAASVFLESAIVLFFAQLLFVLFYALDHPAFVLVAGPVTVIYGLNCTAIMVRVGMNHSYETNLRRESEAAVRYLEGRTSGQPSEGSRSDEKLHSPV